KHQEIILTVNVPQDALHSRLQLDRLTEGLGIIQLKSRFEIIAIVLILLLIIEGNIFTQSFDHFVIPAQISIELEGKYQFMSICIKLFGIIRGPIKTGTQGIPVVETIVILDRKSI